MIPVYEPDLSSFEKEHYLRAFDSGWISSKGNYLDSFKGEIFKYLNPNNNGDISLLSNGTVALHLALKVLGVGPGDEVIVPTLTYIASVNAILYCGATPVFVDSNIHDWNINIDDVKQKITKNTKVIMPVHLFGYPCDMIALKNLTSNNIYILEDAAEALGTKFNGKHVGTFGDAGVYSFFGNKTITTGEGGAIYSSNKNLINQIDTLKSQANSAEKKFWHDAIGYNYRMTNPQAAIGYAQMLRINDIIRKKDQVHKFYKNKLNKKLKWQKSLTGAEVNVWMNSVILPDNKDRDELISILNDSKIESRPVFYPAHQMPYINSNNINTPFASYISAKGISLPSSSKLNQEQLERIVQVVNNYIGT